MKHIIFTLSILCLSAKSFTQPGTLDKSFNDSGKIISSMYGFSALAVQADGKILTGSGGTVGKDTGFTLVRYLEDGSLDNTFGKNGISIINNHAGFSSIALLPDGKIIAGGNYKNMILAKYLSDGRLDSSFGVNGQAFPDIPKSNIACMQLQKDGRIVVIGTAGTEFSHYGIVARFNIDGSIDKNFGSGNGYLFVKSLVFGNVIVVQPDDKILIGGPTTTDMVNVQFATARLQSNGLPDSSFGKNGWVLTSFNDNGESLSALALQPDGKILACGTSNVNLGPVYSKMTVVRYNTDGSMDESFGDKGATFIGMDKQSFSGKVMCLQPDGKIVVADNNSLLVRITQSGILDSSFGTNGLSVNTFGSNQYIYALALQKDSKILQSGNYSFSVDTVPYFFSYAFLARFNNNINQKQVIIAKIRRWVQNHHNGIVWENIPGTKSYTVERSIDNGNWSAVNSHQITLQSSTTVNYYEDPAPANGTNYYRVSTTSTDNAVAVSNSIAITNNNNTSSNISIYPNPVKDELNIKGLNINDTYTIKITNEAGTVVLSKSIINNDSYNCNIKNLSSGIYYISFKSNQKTITLKFVKE